MFSYAHHYSNCLFIQGDSAYGLSPWLMRRYNGANLNDAQRNFNRRLVSARQIIERCIGVLKMRFRCILGERKLRYSPTKVGQIIYSCATLHNYLIANNFDIFHGIDHQLLQNLMNQRNLNNIPAVQQQADFHLIGENRRNQLAEFLMR